MFFVQIIVLEIPENELSSTMIKTLSLESTHRELSSFEWSHLWFRLQENELSSVITQTVPLECTR